MTEETPYRRYDTAAEKLPEHVRRRLESFLPRRVLVVDQDEEGLRWISQQLQDSWEVLGASSAEQAREVLSGIDPVAMVCGLELEDGDPRELLREVREQWPDVRRIVMGQPREDGQGSSLIGHATGIHRYIRKPLLSAHHGCNNAGRKTCRRDVPRCREGRDRCPSGAGRVHVPGHQEIPGHGRDQESLPENSAHGRRQERLVHREQGQVPHLEEEGERRGRRRQEEGQGQGQEGGQGRQAQGRCEGQEACQA